MATGRRDVTDAELAVLHLLWERGQATIRELTDELYPRGGASEYATVQKLLERLEAKGHVARDDSERAHRFRPSVNRARLVALRLQETADRLYDGSLSPLLTHLVEEADLSDEDLEQLRALIRRRRGAEAP